AHAYASVSGRYKPLSSWNVKENGLEGYLALPIAAGTIGGAISSNPVARVSLKIAGISSGKDLASLMVSVGLAQNLAALKALSTEGIQRGHMRLHAANIAIAAGASQDEAEIIAKRMVDEKRISSARAVEILKEIRDSKR
ncbi:MAG: 3-hydroxy-3-methylglutaryl-CoA reductase, partial [Thermoplasmata archaeon]